MRSRADRILNRVTRPEIYEEALIESAGSPIALSVWKSCPEDPVVVFIPGTKTHPLFYEDFLNHLALQKYNVIGMHLVGHGKSPRVKSLYSYKEMLQNGIDTIQYAVNRFNDNIFLIGSSLGGILAADLAGLDTRIKCIFPHNIMIPNLPETIKITRFKNIVKNKFIYKTVVSFVKAAALIFPKLQIPFSFYLEESHMESNKDIFDLFYADPIGLIDYPLFFIASLFNADLKNLYNGSIQCPVVTIVVKDDPIFPFDYNNMVFQLIRSPVKEMLIWEGNRHFIFNECAETAATKLASKIRELGFGSISL